MVQQSTLGVHESFRIAVFSGYVSSTGTSGSYSLIELYDMIFEKDCKVFHGMSRTRQYFQMQLSPFIGKTDSAHTAPWNYPIFSFSFSFSFPLLLFFFSPLFFSFIFLSLFSYFLTFFWCVCVCVDTLGIVPGTSYTSFSFDVVIGLVICKDVRPVNKVCVCVCVCVCVWFDCYTSGLTSAEALQVHLGDNLWKLVILGES